jgi:hypothetical protein
VRAARAGGFRCHVTEISFGRRHGREPKDKWRTSNKYSEIRGLFGIRFHGLNPLRSVETMKGL